ncbi:phage tail tape measure protein [Paenibacillus larvae subsp. pulvifaciens]|uniref:Phage tail tape measure protein n=1 Tax=Paenibacillus larvae subsp. pulvifaciens TaxID=1477 RepID=A0A1V0UYJ9_9BACL|nr:phage tail tape measure protein [Paenibacillus larvae]ARF70325.1 phage tail tape measure protein [Paenibacillus larvae subsp. pulvifaciens]
MGVAVGGAANGGEIRARMMLDLKDFSQKMERARKEMKDTKEKSKKTKESIEKMGKGAAVAGAAMVGGFAAVVKQAADFEQQMSKVKAISGATGEDFQRLNETARHLGATTKFTATQAGEGMEYLALAGWKTNDIISAMPGMLDLAAAGALDLGRAADIVSDTMQAFGLDASTATHAADVFAYAQANANTNVEQMGEAMKYLSPIAHALGWSLEESSAATMSLANSGLKGSIAGQAFASSLARLAKPTKRMAGLMKKTGMEFFDAEGKMKSMPELVAEIEKGTKGMTEQQRSAALSILFGAEAYKHWAILLDTGSGKLKDMTKNLQNCDGTAEQMSKTMIDNLYGSIEIFKSGVSEVAIKLGNHFIPSIRKGVDALTKFVEGLGKIDPNKVEIFLKMAGTAVGILATAGAISKLAGALRTLVLGMGPIGWVITGLSVLGSVIVGVKTATEQSKTIDLEHIKELQDKTKKVEDLTSQYDKMRDQIKLTNPELMHYRELQQDAARETDPKKIEEYAKEMEGLEKKSGLSREQLKKFFDVNDDLIGILPEAEVKIDKHGKALLENSKKAKECVDQLKELAETEAKNALIDVENNYDKHIRDYEAALKDTSDAAQTLNDKRIEKKGIERDLVKLEDDLLERQKKGDKSAAIQYKQWIGEKKERLNTLKKEISSANENHKVATETLQTKSKTLQTDKEVFNKLAQIYLEQVGLNGAAEEGLEQVNKKLEGLEGEKKKLEDIKKKKGSLNEKQQEELEGLDKNIQKHKEVRGKLEGIIKTQDKVNSKIDDATSKGQYMTQVLGEDVLKDIKFTGNGIEDAKQLNDALSKKIQKEITFKYGTVLEGTMPTEFKPSNAVPGYGLPDQFAKTNSNMFKNTNVIRRVYRHQGGTFPKLHAGGSPMFSFGNAPKAHEIDVRLLRNEMVLTEAQQANLFALIKNFDSIARKAETTIRGGDDEPRYDQTTIQIGQLVVREEADIYRVAEELDRIKRQKDRSKGVR